jgi:hypothetical protein
MSSNMIAPTVATRIDHTLNPVAPAVRRCILPLPIGWLRGDEPSDLLPQEDPAVGILFPCLDENLFQALAEAITVRGGVSPSDGRRRRPVFCSDLALQPRKTSFSSQGRYARRYHLGRRSELGGPSATGRDRAELLARSELFLARERAAARPAETVPRWVRVPAQWARRWLGHGRLLLFETLH